MLTIAVTGGIASGKTTVANLFHTKYGIPIIDSDQIAKEAVDNNIDVLNKIKQKFGPNILINNTQLDRKKLRDIVFNNKSSKQWLEQLLHPIINRTMQNQINQFAQQNSHKYCLVMIPLITQEYLNNNKFIDKVLVVTCPKKNQLNRATIRDNQNENQINKIIDAQLNDEQRLKFADYIIDNSLNIENLNHQIEAIHNKINNYYIC